MSQIKSDNTSPKKSYLDYIVLGMISIISLLYIQFQADFAETHIQFPFLDFPVFVGEILLFFCLIGLLIKYKSDILKLVNQYVFIVAFMALILLKACWGYVHHGPLALRHAALFYYSFFAVIGYLFYNLEFFKRFKYVFFALVILFFISRQFYPYWTMSLFICALIVILNSSSRKLRFLLLMLLLIVTPYQMFFNSARMMIVAQAFVLLFFLIVFLSRVKVRRRIKAAIMFSTLLFLILGFYKFGDFNAIRSIVSIDEILSLYDYYTNQVRQKLRNYDRSSFANYQKIQVYHPNTSRTVSPESAKSPGEKTAEFSATETERVDEARLDVAGRVQRGENSKNGITEMEDKKISLVKEEAEPLLEPEKINVVKEQATKEDIDPVLDAEEISVVKEQAFFLKLLENKSEERNYSVACSNAVFRLLIWTDMIDEFMQKQPFLLGFDFGHPIRSKSLEILRWGHYDYLRDGWIAAHNSFLHMLYQLGFAGFLFILFILKLFIRMIIIFIKQNSLIGILLVGIILNWFMAANFLLILELPYTAIPLWTLFGLTYAYGRDQDRASMPKGLSRK